MGLVSMESIARFEFGAGPKRQRIEALLKTLTGHLHAVETALRGQINESEDAPIVTMPNAHREFCRDVLEPFGSILQTAYWESIGFGGLASVAEDTEAVRDETFLLNAFSWGLERWSDAMDDEERDEWLCRGFKLEEALEMVATPWFRPDDWKENMELLRPVLLDRPSKDVRDHARYRLTEIYRSFTFGLWMGSIVLCRSLVEFSMRQNARRWEIDPTRVGRNGSREDKTLRELGEEFTVALPELGKPVQMVRESGNRVVHPSKHDVIAHPKVRREEALDCIRSSRLIVEILYSSKVSRNFP